MRRTLLVAAGALALLLAVRRRPRRRGRAPPKLCYWNTRCLARPIRLLLAHALDDRWEDATHQVGPAPAYDKSSWLAEKPTLGMSFPNLPYYIGDGLKLAESGAILRHVAREHAPALLGRSPAEQAVVDMLCEVLVELHGHVITLAYYASDWEADAAQYHAEVIPRYLPGLARRLAGAGPWLLGEQLSIADFHLYELMDQHRMMLPGSLGPFPALQTHLERVEALPRVRAFLERTPRRPVNNVYAVFK